MFDLGRFDCSMRKADDSLTRSSGWLGLEVFWEPLDEQFLTAMIDYAENNGFDVVSPFSTLNYFSYLTWTAQLGSEPTQQVRTVFYQQADEAMSANELSAVGETVESLASRAG